MSLADITLVSLAEIVGDFAFKNVARGVGDSVAYWSLGLGGYAGVITFLIRSLKVGNVAYVNGMWDGTSALLETLAAVFIFGEKLKTWYQYLALGFIIFGIFLLQKGGIPK